MPVNGSIDLPITGGGGGSGDVVGPSSAVDEDIAVFDGTTGKLIKDGGMTIAQVIAAATVSGTPNNVVGTLVQRDGSSYFDTSRIYYDRINSYNQYFDFQSMLAIDSAGTISIDLINRNLLNNAAQNFLDWSGNAVGGPLLPASVPLYFLASDSSGYISISAPSGVSTYGMTWPSTQASSPGQVLTNSDAAGTLTWASPSGGSFAVQAVNSNITAADKMIYLVDTTGGAVTIQLPAPSGIQFYVKDVGGQSNTNNITVSTFGSENIEGVGSAKIFQTNYGSWYIVGDGTNWWML